jgi:hypothetical protein
VKGIAVDDATVARKAFAHDAVVAMQSGGSPNAPGGAITLALCGSWDHPPPCPLAPHYVTNTSTGESLALRVLFATEPVDEQRVRALIGEALATGRLQGPDGQAATWQLRSAAPGTIRADEEDHAAHLVTHWGLAPEGRNDRIVVVLGTLPLGARRRGACG